MDAAELYKSGDLPAAIDAQIAVVKSQPADQKKRLFLFELFAFAGEIDRARKQIDVLNFSEMELQAAAVDYRKCLESETARRSLFSDGVSPKFLTEAPEHVRLRLQAVNCLREQHWAEASELLGQAAELMPELTGQFGGQPFAGFCDCDDLLGGVLEVFAQGNYFWVPLEMIDLISISPPKYPRDLLWVPARLETTAGESGQVFLPSLYPGSHAHTDPLVKLGRATDWESQPDGPVQGKGLKMYLLGDDSHSILDWRQLQLDQKAPPAE